MISSGNDIGRGVGVRKNLKICCRSFFVIFKFLIMPNKVYNESDLCGSAWKNRSQQRWRDANQFKRALMSDQRNHFWWWEDVYSVSLHVLWVKKIWMLLWNQNPNFVITFYIFYLLSSGVHTQTHMLSKVLEFWLLLIIYLLNFKNFHLSILMELNSLLICCLWHYKA